MRSNITIAGCRDEFDTIKARTKNSAATVGTHSADCFLFLPLLERLDRFHLHLHISCLYKSTLQNNETDPGFPRQMGLSNDINLRRCVCGFAKNSAFLRPAVLGAHILGSDVSFGCTLSATSHEEFLLKPLGRGLSCDKPCKRVSNSFLLFRSWSRLLPGLPRKRTGHFPTIPVGEQEVGEFQPPHPG